MGGVFIVYVSQNIVYVSQKDSNKVGMFLRCITTKRPYKVSDLVCFITPDASLSAATDTCINS